MNKLIKGLRTDYGFDKAVLFLALAQEMQKEIVQKDEENDHKKVKYLLADQAQMLSFADRELSRFRDKHLSISIKRIVTSVQFEHNQVMEDRQFYMNRSISSLLREQGLHLLDQVVNESEEVNMEMVWEIVDMFRHAMMTAVEYDTCPCNESEARASAEMGFLFATVLKLDEYANRYLTSAIRLCEVVTAASAQPSMDRHGIRR